MLQQILKDMYIDPDVLEALNDDQKKTLFLKMRQEQVRRWKEHEENETERRPKPKTSTANRKNVSWLLGRDGDVAVMVIGEVDEMKTSRLICAGPVEKRTPPSLLNNSSHQINPVKGNLVDRADPEPVRTGRDNLPPKAQPVTQLNLKENGEEVKTVPPLEVTVTESQQTAEAELRQELDVEDTEEEPVLLSYRPHPRVNDSTLSPLKINSPPVPHYTQSPVLSPTSPPVLSPTSPPVLSPTSPPVLSPTSPPVLSPTSPPVLSPTSPPVLSPTCPPVLSPTSPPVPNHTLSPVPNSISSPVFRSTSPPVPTSTLPPVSKSTLSPVISSTLSSVPISTSPPFLRSTSPPALNTTYPHVPSSTSPPVSSINVIRDALEKSAAKGCKKNVTPPPVEPPSSVAKTTHPPIPSITARSPIPKTTSPILTRVTSPSPSMEPSHVPSSPRSLVPIIYTPAPFHRAVGVSHVSSSAAIRGSLKSFAKTHSLERTDVTPPPITTRLHPTEPADPQDAPSSRDIRVMAASHRAMSEDVASEGSGDTIKGRGRVAQLMKTFSAKSPALPSQSPPRSNKPPLPTKPSHLRLAANPALR